MFNLIDPEKEFLVVKHSHLNNSRLNIESVVEEAMKLEKHTNGRRVVVALEGDIIQLDNREVILTPQNYLTPSSMRFRELQEAGIGVYLTEALDNYQTFKEQYAGRVVLCLELKAITTIQTITKTVTELKRRRIKHVYFDSFFGRCLKHVMLVNKKQGTRYGTSRHLLGNVGHVLLRAYGIGINPICHANIVTVPYPLSWGSLGVPVIYGAVGSPEKLERIAENPECYGAYVRFKEGHGRLTGLIRLLAVSMTNKPETRKY